MLLLVVSPIGERAAKAMICRDDGSSELETYPEPTYPRWAVDQGERLRTLRIHPRYRSLREAAILVGLRPAEVSDLEHGRRTFATTVDAEAYRKALGC